MHKESRRRRTIPNGVIIRALVLFLPLGLVYVWKRQCRWGLGLKALVSVVSILCVIGLFMGTLSFFPTQEATRVQASALQKKWQEQYPLMADPDGACYHVEGCIHTQQGATPIALQNAFQMGISPDIYCNPPRYDSRN